MGEFVSKRPRDHGRDQHGEKDDSEHQGEGGSLRAGFAGCLGLARFPCMAHIFQCKARNVRGMEAEVGGMEI